MKRSRKSVTGRKSAARTTDPVRRQARVLIRIASRAIVADSAQPSRAADVILSAALHLYGREGFAAVTMRALAREIGCSAGALYTHFLNKHEIFLALQGQGLRLYAETVVGITADDPVDALRRYFLGYYEFSKVHPAYFALLWVDHIAPRVDPSNPDLQRAIVAGHALVQRCLDERIFPAGLTPPLVTRVLWSAVHGPAVLHDMPNGAPGSEGDLLARATLDLALAGLRAGVLTVGSSGHVPSAPVQSGGSPLRTANGSATITP